MTNLGLDLLDLFDRLLFIQPVDEQIDIRGRRQLLMVVLSKRTLGFTAQVILSAKIFRFEVIRLDESSKSLCLTFCTTARRLRDLKQAWRLIRWHEPNLLVRRLDWQKGCNHRATSGHYITPIEIDK